MEPPFWHRISSAHHRHRRLRSCKLLLDILQFSPRSSVVKHPDGSLRFFREKYSELAKCLAYHMDLYVCLNGFNYQHVVLWISMVNMKNISYMYIHSLKTWNQYMKWEKPTGSVNSKYLPKDDSNNSWVKLPKIKPSRAYGSTSSLGPKKIDNQKMNTFHLCSLASFSWTNMTGTYHFYPFLHITQTKHICYNSYNCFSLGEWFRYPWHPMTTQKLEC